MGSRFEKFSERARRVLSLAQEEAQRFNHNYIGTEHILLGLVRETEGVAARVLSSLSVDLTKVRSAVEFIIGRGERAVQALRQPFHQMRLLAGRNLYRMRDFNHIGSMRGHCITRDEQFRRLRNAPIAACKPSRARPHYKKQQPGRRIAQNAPKADPA